VTQSGSRTVEGSFRQAAELLLERHDTLTTPLLSGLSIPLARIFA
jgi:hypothetical protein